MPKKTRRDRAPTHTHSPDQSLFQCLVSGISWDTPSFPTQCDANRCETVMRFRNKLDDNADTWFRLFVNQELRIRQARSWHEAWLKIFYVCIFRSLQCLVLFCLYIFSRRVQGIVTFLWPRHHTFYMSYILHEVVCNILHVFFLLFGVPILHLILIVCIRGDL